MIRKFAAVATVCIAMSISHAADVDDDVQKQIDSLTRQLESLKQQVEKGNATKSSPDGGERSELVNLQADEIEAIDDSGGSNVLSKPWWRNFHISGFGAAGYYDTGSAGTRDNGGFEIKEASLFVLAEAWNNVDFFIELQTNRLGSDSDKYTRTGEVYVHFHDIALTESITVGAKLGRIDIPFGEEYLWQDAIDNPLITNSAAYPYGWDEGVLLYGDVGGVNWIVAVTDGTDDRSVEENSDKAINVKVYGSPLEPLYLSFSLMTNGDVSKSAIEFGGSHFRPVGVAHQSTLGASADTEVSAQLIEVNAKYEFSFASSEAYIAASMGSAEADDSDAFYRRDLRWFSLEPGIQLHEDWFATLRYSEIGTYDGDAGYHFDGKTFAGGNAAFGYDVRRFQRSSVALNWMPNPHLRGKLEIARDRFELIDASPLNPRNGDRGFAGLEIAVAF